MFLFKCVVFKIKWILNFGVTSVETMHMHFAASGRRSAHISRSEVSAKVIGDLIVHAH